MTDDVQPVLDMITVGPVETNCFLLHAPNSSDPKGCFVVDCGIGPQPILERIDQQDLEPRGLLLTHCHYDHIGGIEELFARYGTLPTWVHPIEASWNGDPEQNLSAMSPWPCVAPKPDRTYEDGDTLDLLGTEWRVLHLPGHSPGSVGLLNESAEVLIAGDTLFAGSVGRIDFPTSSPADMRKSLGRLLELPEGTRVLPGHGPGTSIAAERRANPFLKEWELI
jgi:glyoxylase-like metal-dependent hydrolase (beta-lactamase superfamily II)